MTMQPIDDNQIIAGHITTCANCGCRGVYCHTTVGIVNQDGAEIPIDMASKGLVPLLAGKEDGSETDSLFCEGCALVLTTFFLEMEDGVETEVVDIAAESLEEATKQIQDEAEAWCGDGEWGDDGATISINWRLFADEDLTEELDSGSLTVEIEAVQ